MSKERLEGQNTNNNVLTSEGVKTFRRRNKIKTLIGTTAGIAGIGAGIGIGYGVFHNENKPDPLAIDKHIEAYCDDSLQVGVETNVKIIVTGSEQIVFPTSGNEGIGTDEFNLPTGVNALWSKEGDGTIALSGIPTTEGTYVVKIVVNDVSTKLSITVLPPPVVEEEHIEAYCDSTLQLEVEANAKIIVSGTEGIIFPTSGNEGIGTNEYKLPEGIKAEWSNKGDGVINLSGIPTTIGTYVVEIEVNEVSTKTSISVIPTEVKISFVELDNGDKVEFYADTTPLTNFCSTYTTTTVEINNIGYDKSEIKAITFGDDYGHIKIIDDNFISGFNSLSSIDFSGLESVESIGFGWLFYSNVTNINFKGLSNLKTIGDNWLAVMSSNSIDFNGLDSLTTIADNWLRNSAINSINFNGLTNLNTVGSNWFRSGGINSLNFTGLTNLKTVGDYWLSDVASLKSIDFNGLDNLTSVGSSWFRNDNSIETVNFQGLSNLTTIGYGIFSNCSGLTSVDLSALVKLTNLDSASFINCQLLTSITVNNLSWGASFSEDQFGDGTTPTNGTFYAATQQIGESWLKGNLATWSVVVK